MKSKARSAGKTLTPLLVIFAFVILISMILLSLRSMHSAEVRRIAAEHAENLRLQEQDEAERLALVSENKDLTPLSIFSTSMDGGILLLEDFQELSLIPDYRKSLQAVWIDEEMGKLKEAEQTLRTLLLSYPDAVDLLAALGRICYTQGNYADAEIFFKRQLKIYPDDPSVLNNLAMSQMGLEHYSDAL